MDLKNLNLVELDAQEMVNVDGGGFWDTIVEYVVTTIIEAVVEDAIENPTAYTSSGATTTMYGHYGAARP